MGEKTVADWNKWTEDIDSSMDSFRKSLTASFRSIASLESRLSAVEESLAGLLREHG